MAAGQVVVSSVSTSPLPYDTMTNRCETFGTGTRQKISKWLATENRQVNGLYRNSLEESCALEKVSFNLSKQTNINIASKRTYFSLATLNVLLSSIMKRKVF